MKYFVVSDIHSFATELKLALKQAGFNKRDKNHTLIVVGDVFDRGPDALEVYKFLTSIPKKRCILIRGNHEDLYMELLDKSRPDKYDKSNGTFDTFCQISGLPDYSIYDQGGWRRMSHRVQNHEITAWIASDRWKNYYEVGPYIFTHSFIPTTIKKEYEKFETFYTKYELPDKFYEYNPDWRNANAYDWYWARWGCPYSQYLEGLFDEENKNGKVLVVGHWHTSAFFHHLKNFKGYDKECAPIYFSKNLIGIDGGVVYDEYTHKLYHPQNVLVIDEDFKCYDKNGLPLEEMKLIPIIETVTVEEEEK